MHFGFAINYYICRLTYHPGAPHQHHAAFQGYHKVDWDKGEVDMVQPGHWMQTATQPTPAYIPTKMWPSSNEMNFTDGADTPKAVEQQKWHPQFTDFFENEYPELLLTHDFKASTVKHGVVHNIQTKPNEKPYKFKGRQLNGKTIFSKIDLTKEYHLIPKTEADRHKTAVITPWGLFEFNRLPMRLSSAQAFQRLIEEITQDLDFC